MMDKQALLLLSVVTILLSGCGGGGGGGNVNTASGYPIRIFSDGAGVAKIVDGTRSSYYIGPEVTGVVAGINSPDDSTDVLISDFPVVGTTAYSNVRVGAISSGGLSANVTVYEDFNTTAGVILFDFPTLGGLNFALSTGNQLGTLPSGTARYLGTFGASLRSNGYREVGTFSMTANFSNSSLAMSGATTNYALTGSASIQSNGDFAGSGVFSDPWSSYSTTLWGAFYGSGGQGVAGVYHTNEANPFYAGAFAGGQR